MEIGEDIKAMYNLKDKLYTLSYEIRRIVKYVLLINGLLELMFDPKEFYCNLKERYWFYMVL